MADEEVREEPQAVRQLPAFVKPLFMLLVPLLIGGALVYGIAKQKPEFLGLPKGSAQIQAEVDALVKEVGVLIELPKDEKPTVATVTDLDKVKDQTFFKSAKNGDKVLIYTNAKKAILYRPSENRIIEVGAVNINQQPQAEETPSPSPSPKATETPQGE